MCDYVAVCRTYCGIYRCLHHFENPLHPYTKGLNESIPRMDEDRETLETIKGIVPDLLYLPSGCPFHPRCEYAVERCLRRFRNLLKLSLIIWLSAIWWKNSTSHG